MSRILIFGGAGQLGQELARRFADAGEVVCHDRRTVDLSSEEQLRGAVRAAAPNVILNAAAYTAVDKAESEPELAMAVNGRAPGILAEEALRSNALLVHYSTDYVFDGTKAGAWTEADATNPLNVYGATKLAGEEAIRQVGGRALVFRTSWVYGPSGKNFLLTMLRLGRERERLSVVADQIGAPTTVAALAEATRSIVDGVADGRFGETERWAGLYHMTCGGAVSWHGFAEQIFDRAEALGLLGKAKPEVLAIPSSAYPTPAKRPANSALSNEKLREVFEIQLPAWQDALDSALGSLLP